MSWLARLKVAVAKHRAAITAVLAAVLDLVNGAPLLGAVAHLLLAPVF